MNRSKTLRWTRIRLRAQQSWPALSKTDMGAVAAARSRSASSKTTLALLPPSSRVTRFTWSAAPRMIRCPTCVEPVKQILRTAGCVTNRSPTTEPRPARTVSTPFGQPRLQGQLAQPHRRQGRQLGRLEDDGVAGGQRRRQAPAGDGHGEVPRDDDPDDAERLLERDVDPAGHRDLPAEEALRCGGVVGQHVADVAGLPPGVADRVPGVAAPPGPASSSTWASTTSANRRSSRPRSAGLTALQAGPTACAVAIAASVCSTVASGTVETGWPVEGLRTTCSAASGLGGAGRRMPLTAARTP